MHKPSPSRTSALMALAAAIGMQSFSSTAQVFSQKRGKAPKGRKWRSGVYIPAGPSCNVEPTTVRNPKVAAQMNAMFDKWNNARIARQAANQQQA